MAVKPPLTLAVNKRYLPWLAAALAILAVWLAAAVFYRAQFQQMRQQVETQLTTIETLKIAQIMAWRSERQSDAGALMGSPFLIDGIARWWPEPTPFPTNISLSHRLPGWPGMPRRRP